jgi:hypothetical protein
MGDSNTILARLQTVLANKDFLTSSGDLLAIAEAFYAATSEGVNNVARKLIDAARSRLAQLSLLNDLNKKLGSLAPVDSTTVALGATKADCDALVAELGKAGITLTTKSSYYLSSQTYNSSGTLVGAIGPHIASASEKTVAEGGTLIGQTAADGDETRLVAGSSGSYTLYYLNKSDTVLTAAKTDVNTALGTIATDTEPLLETASEDALNIAAFLKQHPPQKKDGSIDQSREEERNRLNTRLGDFLELARVATQRAQERRNEVTARSSAAN